MKRFLIILVVIIMTVSCSTATDDILIVTGSTGGTYYPLGNKIAEVLTDGTTDYVVSAYAGNASVQNSKMIGNEEVDMALVQSNVAYWATKGSKMFEEPVSNMRGIAVLYPEVIQIVARKDANITSVRDLVGKRVSIGKEGSGNYFDALTILSAYNIQLDDVDVSAQQSGEATEALISDSVDAVFITSGIPNGIIQEVASEIDITIIPLDEDMVVQISSKEPYLSRSIIEANTYKGVTENILTLETPALWVCKSDLDDDLIYEMTSIFWENHDIFNVVAESINAIQSDNILNGMSIELHPGAMKYYEEVLGEVD
jgi:TRAP transporter TAXI family solute receptor